MTTITMNTASLKQIDFIAKLVSEGRDVTALPATATDTLQFIKSGYTIGKVEASGLIGALLSLPKPVPQPSSDPVTEPGMYRTAANVIFRVQKSRESEKLYAKQLVQRGDIFQFEYAPGAIRAIKASDRMTLAEAKAFGLEFGVCCVCSAILTNPKSIAAGIGPVCGKKV